MCPDLHAPCPNSHKAVLWAHCVSKLPESLDAVSTEKHAQPAASVVCSSKSSSASVWFSLTSPLGAPLLLAAWYSLPSLSFSKLLRTMMDSRITSTVLSRTYTIHSFIRHSIVCLIVPSWFVFLPSFLLSFLHSILHLLLHSFIQSMASARISCCVVLSAVNSMQVPVQTNSAWSHKRGGDTCA